MHLHLRAAAITTALAVASSVAMATPIGMFSLSSVTNGSVAVSATRIDFYPPVNAAPAPPGVGDFSVGGQTNIAFSGGNLTPTTNPYGQVKDLDIVSTPPPVANFISFYVGTTLPTPPGTGVLTPAPAFDFVGFAPSGSAQGALNNCAGVTAVGVSCSPMVTVGSTTFMSPFVLTNRGLYTDVSIGMFLSGHDATGSTGWSGGLTTQVTGFTPDQIQTLINSGGTLNAGTTFSGVFVGQGIPEPATVSLIGLGLASIGFFGRKLQKKA